MWKKLIATSPDVTMFVLRFVLGSVVLAHGLQKLFGWFGGHGVSETIQLWQKWFQLPPFLTFLVILGETLGCLALILGFAGRVFAAVIGVIMLGAIYFVHHKWGFYMNWYAEQRGEGFEYHLLVLSVVVAILIKGSGKWSIDLLLQRSKM